jgi:hypothetical protein
MGTAQTDAAWQIAFALAAQKLGTSGYGLMGDVHPHAISAIAPARGAKTSGRLMVSILPPSL